MNLQARKHYSNAFTQIIKTAMGAQIIHTIIHRPFLTPFHLDRASLLCQCARLGEQRPLGKAAFEQLSRNNNKEKNGTAASIL